MKTTIVFESKIRGSSYASLDAARSALKADPLVGDYLVDLLISRGVMAVNPDGSVQGLPVATKVRDESDDSAPGKHVSLEWKEIWPTREQLINALQTPCKFRELQARLAADAAPHTHWIVLHALWFMENAGEVRKRGGLYRLAGDLSTEPLGELTLNEERALDKHIIKLLKETPGLTLPDLATGTAQESAEVFKRLELLLGRKVIELLDEPGSARTYYIHGTIVD